MIPIPIVSVIVPIYKVEKYICSCLDSIRSQTMKDIEIICVDDGSPDRCGLICDEYASVDHRIKVIHQKNQGLSAARNQGVAIAAGKYLCFVDSDDRIQNTMVEKLYQCMAANHADISSCRTVVFYDDKLPESHQADRQGIIKLDRKQAFQSILAADDILSYSAWGKMYKRELFHSLRYPEGRIYEDAILLPQLLGLISLICREPGTCYYYRIREGSIMREKFSAVDLQRIAVADSFSEQTLHHYPELISQANRYRVIIRVEIANKLLYSDNYRQYLAEYKQITAEIRYLYKTMAMQSQWTTCYFMGLCPNGFMKYTRLRARLAQVGILRAFFKQFTKCI